MTFTKIRAGYYETDKFSIIRSDYIPSNGMAGYIGHTPGGFYWDVSDLETDTHRRSCDTLKEAKTYVNWVSKNIIKSGGE